MVKQETLPMAQPEKSGALTPMDMLQIAVERNADVDTMTKLLELQERWERNESRKAFVAALTAFKANPPTVVKNRHVGFRTRQGGETEYDHATLDQVCDVIAPALSEHGLSHAWETGQGDGFVTVTCVLTHGMGHSERTTLSGPIDQSGGKNAIQAIGSTVTYLQRYTLLAATGLAAKDQDNDAGSAFAMVNDEQLNELMALADEVGADKRKFCEYMGVDAFAMILAKDFDRAKTALEAKRK